MAPMNNFFRAARPVFRNTFFTSNAARNGGKRFQSTASSEQAQESFFKRMWNSPVGFKTVHFWAPVMKWGLVLAGISDFARPAEKLSLTQNGALTATGLIWTRWCLIIKPKNYLLAAVNFFLGMVGIVQVSRILLWQQSQKNKTLPAAAEEVKETLKEGVEKVEKAVKA
ncbi:hypothetical protein SMACR_02884 [Sordaria macrospora]|uniref:Mitochondrial pyruvate carrier n=2 Tax=Sordaria macrospora TaxID=5147 RepID=F7VXR4_SORMK|nr:uncharacterized protein SMAC_02884 [Sordaria macrospora k-hell]KAA8629961.1 hypothetical protein SMACR_02884 [Sordaria macrospora]KAH7634997.1 hypothetical protein B0T09DRAFT_15844 [Sordaria sp. MPI-SDFR-AT-0083]WPJ58240.1 hypothetical protein SMAC4_02884 [Sordaria macrospora]CCC10308.1 unnamed protein product [Sordaria macrospora k-hell]